MKDKGFEFEKKEVYSLKLTIDKKEYTCYPLELKTATASNIFVKRVKPIVNKLKSKKLSQEELGNLQIQYCRCVADAINSILGKGSYNRIFEHRMIDYVEHDKVLAYIFEEIGKYKEEFSKQNEKHTDNKAANIN